MSEKVECVADGANQSLHVGDWVAGVRIEPRVHTVVGKVRRLTPTTAVIEVTWVSEPDPGLRGLALQQRAQVGGDTRVGLARVFRLAPGAGEEQPNLPLQRAVERARELIVHAGEVRAETGTGNLVDAYREAIQVLSATRDELAAANAEVARLRTLIQGDGLTEGRGESVLDRHAVQLRYASALDRAMPGFEESSEEVRQVAWGLAEVVLRVRDRELGMLRQRLSLDAESLLETGSEPEAPVGERGVDRKRATQLTRLLELDAGVTWMDTLMAVVKLKVTAARVGSAERETATLREWTRVAKYAVGANVEPDRLEALADWFDQLDRLRAVPGARPSNEVQRDLRTWATLLRASAADELSRLGQEMEMDAAEVTKRLGEVDRGCDG